MLKRLWSRLFSGGGAAEGGADAAQAGEAVEHKGFRIRPTPYKVEGQYQTAGIIEKDIGGLKEYRFVRAERHASREAAASFAITKGMQIIDEQGDRMFAPPPQPGGPGQ